MQADFVKVTEIDLPCLNILTQRNSVAKLLLGHVPDCRFGNDLVPLFFTVPYGIIKNDASKAMVKGHRPSGLGWITGFC